MPTPFASLTLALDALLDQKQFVAVQRKVARALRGKATTRQRTELLSRLFWAASGLQQSEAYEDAARAWTAYLKHDPSTPRAWQYRGRCLFHLGEPARAVRDHTRQVELAPGDRAGWLSRAEAYAAIGDAARATADQERADAIYDFPIARTRLRQLRALRLADPERNLAERLAYFRSKNAALVERRFGFVPMVQQHRWACAHFAGDAEAPLDLTYTIGLYYRYGHPELHVRSRGVAAEELKVRLNAIGHRVAKGHRVGAAPEEGLRFRAARPAVLEAYPFGFGEYFYRHFADTSVVPLRAAVLLR